MVDIVKPSGKKDSEVQTNNEMQAVHVEDVDSNVCI